MLLALSGKEEILRPIALIELLLVLITKQEVVAGCLPLAWRACLLYIIKRKSGCQSNCPSVIMEAFQLMEFQSSRKYDPL